MKKVTAAILSLMLIAGCVSITPEQERYWALYKSDPHAPKIENRYSETQMAAISLFFPGLGHILMGEPEWAPLWFFLGIISPGTAPTAAVADTRTVNMINVAEAYKTYLEFKPKYKSPDDLAIEVYCGCGAKVRADAHYCPNCGRSR
jgi:hypothetical protein